MRPVVAGRRAASTVAVVLAVALAVVGCSVLQDAEGDADRAGEPAAPGSASPSRSPEPATAAPGPTTASPDSAATADTATGRPSPTRQRPRGADPVIERIPDRQWRRIVATEVWRPECPVGRAELRRVRVSYVSFEGRVRRGTLVVNRDVASSIARIFTRLFDERFPIRRMRPVEAYGGDVNASLAADNTSAYNCRQPDQINAPVTESPHANGRAIDINPRENPWVDLRCDCWLPSPADRARNPGRGKILRGGLVWRVFRSEGWIWQNIDVPDYMHFDTGYPSRRYRGPEANKRRHERQRVRQRRERARG